MRVLLDTNILILLEDSSNGILDESLHNIVTTSDLNGVTLFHHPKSLADIQNDKNEPRKNSILSRLKKYHLLEESTSKPDEEYFISVGETVSSKGNDKIDNHILYSVFNNQVRFLITQDKGIHKKAKRLGISEKVFFAQQFQQFLIQQFPEEIEISDGDILNKGLCDIDKDDVIFSSIKKDYNGFDNWFDKAAQEGRQAWVYADGEGLKAICIYKPESTEIITNDNKGLSGKSLKLSTFKVSEDFFGRKIGESLLRLALKHAITNQFKHVYLTVRKDKHEYFENFLLNFGFYKFGITLEGDDVIYCKTFKIPEYKSYNYPCIRKDGGKKSFLIPIKPVFHSVLLGACDKQQGLFKANLEPVRQAIRKAYLCHSNTTKMSTGDIVYFYKTEEEIITSFGILEQVFDSDDVEEVIGIVAKRSVYSHKEIKEMCSKTVKVVSFLFVDCFNEPINLVTLKQKKLVNGHPQSITEISKETSDYLIRAGNHERYFLSN
jgi:predicted nucleic acid-binding protein